MLGSKKFWGLLKFGVKKFGIKKIRVHKKIGVRNGLSMNLPSLNCRAPDFFAYQMAKNEDKQTDILL